MPVPELPVLPEDTSMLSRKFGREVANYFAGSPLNRVSFLRTDHDFLQAAFAHPSANFLLMNKLGPLVRREDPSRLAFAKRADIVGLTGENPFTQTEEEMIKAFDSSKTQVIVLFLGIKEPGATTSGDAEVFEHKEYKGTPYFAIDVTPHGSIRDAANAVISAMKEKGLSFPDTPRQMDLVAGEAAMYGQARVLLDWNARNPFCAQCGQPSLSVHAGTKRACPPTDTASGTSVDRLPCATRGTVSNLSFPRSDPTVIAAVVSADGTKILLGRQRRWPKDMYSTLAGFLEPGESIEEAVRREVWEESGVHVGRVVMHSSQPWPFPASLMIGAIGQALPGEGETIHLGHDAELENAKWFTIEEVKKALDVSTEGFADGPPKGYQEGDLRLPPRIAIANRLMTAVVEGWWIGSKI